VQKRPVVVTCELALKMTTRQTRYAKYDIKIQTLF